MTLADYIEQEMDLFIIIITVFTRAFLLLKQGHEVGRN